MSPGEVVVACVAIIWAGILIGLGMIIWAYKRSERKESE